MGAETVKAESWQETRKELGPRQAEVLKLVYRAGAHGITAWEIAAYTGRLVHAVRPRLTELAAMGKVEAFGTRFHAPTGRNEAVWIVPPLGPEQLSLL